MTTQQDQPQTEQPQELALRVGRLEGLMEAVIEQQRGLSDRMDRLEARIDRLSERIDRMTLAVMGGAVVLAAAIIGGFAAFQG
ncbi:MAG: hypothetical protein OXC99_00685 [Chloroflexi bacterium]|nr:hypothetical protein [Chloroflexota bacterium]